MKIGRTDKLEYMNDLKKELEHCDHRVWAEIKHVSQSGMTRDIAFYIPVYAHDGKLSMRNITWIMSKLIDRRYNDKNGGIRVHGCGMDMAYDCIYNLSCRLYSPDGKYDRDAAYKLKREWM